MARVAVEVNDVPYAVDVEPRLLLADFLRGRLKLTGTNIGCEHGVCGTCTVQIDGWPARSCLTLAIQVDGAEVRTIEGLAPADGNSLHPLQRAFHEHHALQCGFCTPGFLMSIEPFLADLRGASQDQIRGQLAGNLCRCTGYQNIVEATEAALSEVEGRSAGAAAGPLVVEHELELPAERTDAWADLADPRPLLVELGIEALTRCGPTGWRGRLAVGSATIAGVVELLDLDDDLQVAHFDLKAREADGPGQVRGALTLSLDRSRLAARLELEFIGTSVLPSHDVLERRFRFVTAMWAAGLGATDASVRARAAAPLQRRRPGQTLGLIALAVAAWLAWRLKRRRR